MTRFLSYPELLNEKASDLKFEREQLLMKQRRLTEALTPLLSVLDAETFRNQLVELSEIIEEAQPEEMQRLMRLLIKQIEWHPDGKHR